MPDTRGLYILTILCFLSVLPNACLSDCETTGSGGMLFSISSKRNQTGHWNAQVHFKHTAGPDNTDNLETGSWDIQLKQITEKCKDRDVVDITAFVTAPPARVGQGYELVPGLGYYKLHTTPKTWPEARETCRLEGAHLAIVNSDKELNALHGIFSLHPKIRDGWENNVAFLGFHDMFAEGQYVTIFGDLLASTGYSQFAPGQPTDINGTTGEDCGCVARNEKLHDVGCMSRLPFFCEQE